MNLLYLQSSDYGNSKQQDIQCFYSGFTDVSSLSHATKWSNSICQCHINAVSSFLQIIGVFSIYLSSYNFPQVQSCGFSGFLPPPQKHSGKWIGYQKLPLNVDEYVHWCVHGNLRWTSDPGCILASVNHAQYSLRNHCYSKPLSLVAFHIQETFWNAVFMQIIRRIDISLFSLFRKQ